MEGGIMTAVQTSNPVHDAEGAVEAGIHEVGATIDAVEREVGRGVSTRFPLNSAFIFTFGALGGMLFGFDTGIISGASPLIESDFGLSVAQTGFITSSVLIGSCAGALSIGALSDRFGRKKLLILAAILFLLGSGMCAGSTGFLMMVVARIILGLAVGAASSLTPAYLAELAPKERRGSLSTLFQLMITFGILLAYASNLGFLGHNIAGIRDWRWMLGSALVPAALLLIGGLLLPESPRYLVSRGKDREAFKVLTLIRKDVDQTQWYHNAVDYVLGNDLMKGTGKTTFSPDATLTRGMVVTVLGRAAGVKTADYAGTSFSDVKAGSWYAPYVQWASKQGLVKGYEDGTFKAGAECDPRGDGHHAVPLLEERGQHLEDGCHRACIAKFFLYSQPSPFLHGVHLTEVQTDARMTNLFYRLKKLLPTWCAAFPNSQEVTRNDDAKGWSTSFYGNTLRIENHRRKGFNADFQAEELEERLIPALLTPSNAASEPIATF